MISVAVALRPLSIDYADQILEDGVPSAEYRGGFRQAIGDGALAGVGVRRTAFDHSLTVTGEDRLGPGGRTALVPVPIVGKGAPLGSWATLLTVQAILQCDLGDDLLAAVLEIARLEGAVGVTPAKAARPEDFVESFDDVGSLDAGQLESPAGIAVERSFGEWDPEGLNLILGQHRNIFRIWFLSGGKKGRSR